MFDIWMRAVTQPNLDNFEGMLKEEPNPELSTPLTWVAVAAAIGAAISGFITLLIGIAGEGSFGALLGGWIGGIIIAPIVSVIGFLIGSAILLFIARQFFGGEGDFNSQSYLLAAVQAPLTIVATPLAAIPIIGALINLIVGLYAIWLNVLAIQASHRMSTGKAVATVLIPAVILFVCVFCGIIGVLTLLGPQISDVFEEIQRELQNP